jgi:hypothetical protein
MNPIATCAEEVLRAHAHPALKISELVELVAQRVDRGLDARRLRTILEEHPDRFRVLEPWAGPWRHSSARAGAQQQEAWVVAISEPRDPPDSPRAALKLRESVRWLARSVDPRSSSEVSHWYAIALAERAARQAVVRRAA